MRLLILILSLLTTPAFAVPTAYDIDLKSSFANFTYKFQNNPVTGSIPIQNAKIMIDLDKMSNSSVAVTLNPARINGGLIFATEALKGKNMFNTQAFPTATFRSTRVTGNIPKGKITGDLNIKSNTRPVTLNAEIFRAKGSAKNDFSNLVIRLKGKINRNDFGLTGYPDLVLPDLDLDIRAVITKR